MIQRSFTGYRPIMSIINKKNLSFILGIIALLAISWFQTNPQTHAPSTTPSTTSQNSFSPELEHTIRLIQNNGPYPHKQDNSIFHNREKRLPIKPRGYYREYTVRTPHLNHRGAKRVVTGGNPPVTYYYTEDHYQSFIKLKVQP